MLYFLCIVTTAPPWSPSGSLSRVDSPGELLNPGNSSALVSSGDYCLWVCRKNEWPEYVCLSLSVREDSWNSIRGGAVQAGCHLLRLIGLIICWTQRRIYSSFQQSVKILPWMCVLERKAFDNRRMTGVSYIQKRKLLYARDYILFQWIKPVWHYIYLSFKVILAHQTQNVAEIQTWNFCFHRWDWSQQTDFLNVRKASKKNMTCYDINFNFDT